MDASHDLFGRKPMSFGRGFYPGHSQESDPHYPHPIPPLSLSFLITPLKESFDLRWQHPSAVTQQGVMIHSLFMHTNKVKQIHTDKHSIKGAKILTPSKNVFSMIDFTASAFF